MVFSLRDLTHPLLIGLLLLPLALSACGDDDDDDDDDECADVACSDNAICEVDDDDEASCVCDIGFSGDGQTCTDDGGGCGTLTADGECDGDTLMYCDDDDIPVAIDCSMELDPNGDALKCGKVAEDLYFDCIETAYAGGCGNVSVAGKCDGTTLSYCTSQSGGEVEMFDCADEGLVCTVTGGVADCATAGASGCGAVKERGSCDGDSVTYCDADEIVTEDCTESSRVCGTDGENYRCIAPAVADGTHNVSGTFVFEKKALTVDGLGGISNKPVRNAHVTVRKSSDNTKLAEGYTGQDGRYALQYEGDGDVYVLVTAQGKPGVHNHIVYDCPREDCGGLGNRYGAATGDVTPAAAADLGESVITVNSGNAGAFNIFDIFVKGADFAKANMGRYPPAVTVHWEANSGTAGGTSYFNGQDGKIHILGGPDDSDEYDDPVLLHEYGHYLEFYLSRSDSPGGSHDGSRTDPRLAWGEGYGTYIGCAIADTPVYIDTTAAGTSAEDVRSNGNEYLADLDDPQQMRQLMSEFLITQVLWTIAEGPDGNNGKTHAPILDVLANYFTTFTSETDGRGVNGVELVDFLDGWFCRSHGDRAYIEGIVNDTAMFPYDYAGPETCN